VKVYVPIGVAPLVAEKLTHPPGILSGMPAALTIVAGRRRCRKPDRTRGEFLSINRADLRTIGCCP
jgi:hypothetical protein